MDPSCDESVDQAGFEPTFLLRVWPFREDESSSTGRSRTFGMLPAAGDVGVFAWVFVMLRGLLRKAFEAIKVSSSE